MRGQGSLKVSTSVGTPREDDFVAALCDAACYSLQCSWDRMHSTSQFTRLNLDSLRFERRRHGHTRWVVPNRG